MTKDDEQVAKPETLTFHYIKTLQYRELYADGTACTVTPRDYISIALFKERPPIPKAVTYEWSDDGTLGDELFRDSKDGIVRSLEANVFLDKAAARALADWIIKVTDAVDEEPNETEVESTRETN